LKIDVIHQVFVTKSFWDLIMFVNSNSKALHSNASEQISKPFRELSGQEMASSAQIIPKISQECFLFNPSKLIFELISSVFHPPTTKALLALHQCSLVFC